jgi:hypothetical protein
MEVTVVERRKQIEVEEAEVVRRGQELVATVGAAVREAE